MANHLANETSPYLKQHAHNPVDWYPWGAEALERARAENKPILLSIGYAACHWCHVMAHESFEDEATAAFMNERFVNIKVDREERPDIDGIYMQAVQAMTGHGGWPMTVFLTPDGVPFYGGTYFPKNDRPGLPSFMRILEALSNAYQTKPADIDRTAESVREMYRATSEQVRGAGALSPKLFDAAYHALDNDYDERHGGFGRAPKFPQVMSLDFLLRFWGRSHIENALAIVRRSFLQMAHGGIYDQVGGGFARYSVDAEWLVPHFEKMLYDNALLIRLGAHLWQATHDDEVKRIVEETIEWAVREMHAPEGGFYSSLDADSEGHEGKFYVWSTEEFDSVLGEDARIARAYWGVTEGGNFEGQNILSVVSDRRTIASRFKISEAALDELLARARTKLFDARSRRVRPGRDDKVLASWNGLMVRGIAEAARAFDNPKYRALAIDAGEFLFESMIQSGRVFRSFSGGRAHIAGYLEDYASLGLAAMSLYELTFDTKWLDRASQLCDATTRWFWDDTVGLFYDTASDQETLIVRPRELTDNAVPSGTSLAIELLARQAELFDNADARRRSTDVLDALALPMTRHPLAFGHALGVADMVVNGANELAIVGDPSAADFMALERAAADQYVPSLVLAGGHEQTGNAVALLAGRTALDGRATAYVCRHYACDVPAISPEQLAEQFLDQGTGGVAASVL